MPTLKVGAPLPPPHQLTLSGELQHQSRCLGVYTLVAGREVNGRPVYKHDGGDYWLAKTAHTWMVQRETNVGVDDTGILTLQDWGRSSPHDSAVTWKEWDGETAGWVDAPTLKCKIDLAGWPESARKRARPSLEPSPPAPLQDNRPLPLWALSALPILEALREEHPHTFARLITGVPLT